MSQSRTSRIPVSSAKRCGALAMIGRVIATWRERCRQRAALARMTAPELKDAQLLPHEARSEIRKPFWRG